MKKPLINPDSEKSINSVIKNLPQSLMITGDIGIGLQTISLYIAHNRSTKPTVILPEKNDEINENDGIISVDIIRRLYQETSTKNLQERIFIIDYAERMTHQAQNAFLKLLEEPGNNIHFILLSHTTSNVLPTILSRVKHINLKPITDKQTNTLLKEFAVTDKVKLSQLLFIASGLPAELTRLAKDENYFKRRSQIIMDAKILVNGRLYQKLLVVQKYKDNRENALALTIDVANILKKSLSGAADQEKIINYIEKALKTYDRILANGNIRLCLSNMVV